ncbi:MAG: hypothetical protein ACLFQK_08255 [Fibrobacterota bacterium]
MPASFRILIFFLISGLLPGAYAGLYAYGDFSYSGYGVPLSFGGEFYSFAVGSISDSSLDFASGHSGGAGMRLNSSAALEFEYYNGIFGTTDKGYFSSDAYYTCYLMKFSYYPFAFDRMLSFLDYSFSFGLGYGYLDFKWAPEFNTTGGGGRIKTIATQFGARMEAAVYGPVFFYMSSRVLFNRFYTKILLTYDRYEYPNTLEGNIASVKAGLMFKIPEGNN